jgi:membrane protein YdbS with pleckstrin-like domain
MDEAPILVARFDPKVKTYWFWQGALTHLVMISAVVGVVTLPVWLFGFGQWLVARRYASMSAVLTARSIHLKTGYLVRVEKIVPLEQIQDLSLNTGPLLRAFALTSVRVETAGGQAANGGADMTLAGLIDAEGFRDAVLRARDALLDQRRSGGPTPAATDDVVAVLGDIRATLRRIEERLASRS